jgi:hypothetical protein
MVETGATEQEQGEHDLARALPPCMTPRDMTPCCQGRPILAFHLANMHMCDSSHVPLIS